MTHEFLPVSHSGIRISQPLVVVGAGAGKRAGHCAPVAETEVSGNLLGGDAVSFGSRSKTLAANSAGTTDSAGGPRADSGAVGVGVG